MVLLVLLLDLVMFAVQLDSVLAAEVLQAHFDVKWELFFCRPMATGHEPERGRQVQSPPDGGRLQWT